MISTHHLDSLFLIWYNLTRKDVILIGKIADTNTRVILTMPKELKFKLEEAAKLENRSLNNMAVTILLEAMKMSKTEQQQ